MDRYYSHLLVKNEIIWLVFLFFFKKSSRLTFQCHIMRINLYSFLFHQSTSWFSSCLLIFSFSRFGAWASRPVCTVTFLWLLESSHSAWVTTVANKTMQVLPFGWQEKRRWVVMRISDINSAWLKNKTLCSGLDSLPCTLAPEMRRRVGKPKSYSQRDEDIDDCSGTIS